jgi:hypothetical protein
MACAPVAPGPFRSANAKRIHPGNKKTAARLVSTAVSFYQESLTATRFGSRAEADGVLVTNQGPRISTALGSTLAKASVRGYEADSKIAFPGAYFREPIKKTR